MKLAFWRKEKSTDESVCEHKYYILDTRFTRLDDRPKKFGERFTDRQYRHCSAQNCRETFAVELWEYMIVDEHGLTSLIDHVVIVN